MIIASKKPRQHQVTWGKTNPQGLFRVAFELLCFAWGCSRIDWGRIFFLKIIVTGNNTTTLHTKNMTTYNVNAEQPQVTQREPEATPCSHD